MLAKLFATSVATLNYSKTRTVYALCLKKKILLQEKLNSGPPINYLSDYCNQWPLYRYKFAPVAQVT